MTSGCPQIQSRLEALTESAVDAIVSCDGSGGVTEWNPAAERMFGYARDEILGRPIEVIIPVRFREAHRAGMARVRDGGPGRRLGTTQEVAAVRKSGEEFPIELSLSRWQHDGERFFTGIIRDIGARKQAERRAHRYARELASALHHLETMFAMVADLLEGQTLEGRYLLERRLRGDQAGALYEAMDLEHRTPVHVRVIRAPRPRELAFDHERIAYPYAATILDIGVTDVGLPYAVTEAMSGERLSERVERRKPITTPEALEWSGAVARSLLAAHRQGEVHGYLCAEGVFLQNADTPAGAVRVLNFELNRLVRAGSAIAEAMGEARGPFCSPELRGPAAPDAPSDAFSLGVLVGFLFAGKEPPVGMTEDERHEWIFGVVPGELAAVVAAALNDRPETRPGVQELAAAIRRAEESYSGPRGNFIGDRR